MTKDILEEETRLGTGRAEDHPFLWYLVGRRAGASRWRG